MSTGPRDRIEPQAVFLWFLAANETREIRVDLIDQRLW